MPIILRLLLLAGMFLPGTATAAEERPGRSLYVMRHLPPDGGPDPGLSIAGAEQAQKLAHLLADRPVRAIFVTATRRSRETAAPLAAKLGLAVSVYDPFQPERLEDAVRAVPGDVLIVGHSNTVADLVARFGGAAPEPLGHGDFGTLWRIDKGRTSTLNIPAGSNR
jgi:broad specificity phosphatase PhoE